MSSHLPGEDTENCLRCRVAGDELPNIHPYRRDTLHCDWCVCGAAKDDIGHRMYDQMFPNEIKIAPPPPEDLNLQEQTMDFVTKDSGERQEFSTGMVRDVQTDKPRYDLLDVPMLKRWAELMARGAKKYGENNWKKAATEEELNRFKASAMRHMFQWIEGDTTEDHGAAVFFNVAGAEMVNDKLNRIYASQNSPVSFSNIRPIHR